MQFYLFYASDAVDLTLLRGEQGCKMFERKLLRRSWGPNRKSAINGWRK
jgi:hypothetical protein